MIKSGAIYAIRTKVSRDTEYIVMYNTLDDIKLSVNSFSYEAKTGDIFFVIDKKNDNFLILCPAGIQVWGKGDVFFHNEILS